MKKILIFAPFPQEKNIKDGKIQRINSIDSELGNGGTRPGGSRFPGNAKKKYLSF